MITYDYEALTFEFSPDGKLTEGELEVFKGEESFGAKLDLASIPSRSKWINAAVDHLPQVFEDDTILKRGIVELYSVIKEKERFRDTEETEEEDGRDLPSHEVDEETVETEISAPDVLNRYVEAMAEVHEVYGDRAQMKAVALNAFSAQLAPLPDGKPVGTNAVLIGESGRGKNYVADAVASGMPEDFVYEFESASAKSFFYEAEAHPDRFQHTWIYPNEAEATDALVETLRPLLSKARAEHKTVDHNAEGVNAFKGLTIKGPITVTIPTVRNKLDTQLQTRMLVMELQEFEDRVPQHSLKVSDTLLKDYAAKDHAGTLAVWKAALRKLTEIRRVVIPTRHENFRLESNKVSHGARLWRNFLSLMLTNAWLEQRNREVIELDNGEKAIVATTEDYRIAYEVFSVACERSVVNLSDTHRKILNAVYKLEQSDKTSSLRDAGFSLRQVGDKAGCSYETVRKHKAYLTQSVGLLRELESGGLRLVKDAEPSWWEDDELLDGFPRPQQVKEWWEGSKGVDSVDSERTASEKPIDKPNTPTSEEVDTKVDVSTQLSMSAYDNENPIDKPNKNGRGDASSVSIDSLKNSTGLKEGVTDFGTYFYED